MLENPYRCSCGKTFKTAQGLAGHQRFCKKATHQSGAEENVAEWEQKFSKLQEKYEALSGLHAGSIRRLNELERQVNLLVGFVCPAGKNTVGVNSSKIIELTGEIDRAKKEMIQSQRAFTREIKAWVWEVIPERFRPKL